MKRKKIKLKDQVKNGYLKEKFSEDGKLVLYNYTNKCIYDKAWNKYTLNLRGHVYRKYNIRPKKLIARAFPKFFNLSEYSLEEQKKLIERMDYECYEKMDGSLGIIYFHENKWRVNTRGSFSSDQSIKAKEMIDEKYDLNCIDDKITLLVEIIYPENKIIIDYEDEEKLVLLTAYLKDREIKRSALEILSVFTGIQIVKKHDLTFDEMFELQDKNDFVTEGFVVKYSNGLRIKIKNKEYLKIARLLNYLTPKRIWKLMNGGKVNKDIIKNIPEEFRKELDGIMFDLEMKYQVIFDEIMKEHQKVMKLSRKEIGLMKGLKYKPAIFLLIENKSIDPYIMKVIKPKKQDLNELHDIKNE